MHSLNLKGTLGDPIRVESYSTRTGIEQGQHQLDEAIVKNPLNDEDERQFDNPIYDVQVKSSSESEAHDSQTSKNSPYKFVEQVKEVEETLEQHSGGMNEGQRANM